MNAKPLNELLAAVGVESQATVMIHDLCIDSRQVTQGSLFLAYPGQNNDGRDFIGAAIAQGAVAVVVESFGYDGPEDAALPIVAVPGLMRKVGDMASWFFDHPSSKCQVNPDHHYFAPDRLKTNCPE